MRRNFIDVVLELMDLVPYRCRSCRRRFYIGFDLMIERLLGKDKQIAERPRPVPTRLRESSKILR